MKLILPQISLHTNDAGKNVRVLSIDINADCDIIASGGADCTVKLWKVQQELPCLKFICNLATHNKSVNVVRFSPNRKLIATASDDGLIFLLEPVTGNWAEVRETRDVTRKIVRGHASDIYALAWSPDSNFLVSGAIDSTTILWKINSAKEVTLLESFRNHCHFVQGVAFHPKGTQFVTQSSDRSCKVYQIKNVKVRDIFKRDACSKEPMLSDFHSELAKPKFVFVNDISKRITAPNSNNNKLVSATKKRRIFLDDSLPSFFRRLQYSPDGNLLIIPAAMFSNDSNPQIRRKCCYVYHTLDMLKPLCALTGFEHAPICVSFCPCKFKRREPYASRFLDTPYRYIFCVITLKDILIYDTQTGNPLAIIEDAHYAQLTDATWSVQDKVITLFVSSSDGYISLIRFSISEIGEVIGLDPHYSTTNLYDFASRIKVAIEAKPLSLALNKLTKKRRLKLVSMQKPLVVKDNPVVNSSTDDTSEAKKIRRVVLTKLPDKT